MREMLRTALVVVLIVMLIGFSVKFLKLALSLLIPAVAIAGILYLLRRMFCRRRAAVEDVEPDYFSQRHPRVSRLEKRIHNLETLIVDERRGD